MTGHTNDVSSKVQGDEATTGDECFVTVPVTMLQTSMARVNASRIDAGNSENSPISGITLLGSVSMA